MNSKNDRVKNALLGALDQWMVLSSNADVRQWIAAVTSSADINQWRINWRQAVLAEDVDELIAISNDSDTSGQSPRSVLNLCRSIQIVSPVHDVTSILQQSYSRHPGDFWMNYALGTETMFGKDLNIPLQYFSVAQSIRPIKSPTQQISRLYAKDRKYIYKGWKVLTPFSIKSEAGASFSQLPDRSFLVTGPITARDVYTIDAKFNPSGLRSIRLDLIKDDRLPGNGPGRHESGNFHLAELTLELLDENESGGVRSVPFTAVSKGYQWHERPRENAIDGDPDTLWHVWGMLNISHMAVFRMEPLPLTDVRSIRIRMIHGGDHVAATIGRFRLLYFCQDPAETSELNTDTVNE